MPHRLSINKVAVSSPGTVFLVVGDPSDVDEVVAWDQPGMKVVEVCSSMKTLAVEVTITNKEIETLFLLRWGHE